MVIPDALSRDTMDKDLTLCARCLETDITIAGGADGPTGFAVFCCVSSLPDWQSAG
jgi:hypothetical protein